jgi:hypothetical protein
MFEGILESMEGMGAWALAAGVAVVAGPTIARALRPAAKSMIKGYLAFSEKAQVATQETRESLQDLVAEAKAEVQSEAAAG